MERVDAAVLETIQAHVKLHYSDKLKQWEASIATMLPRDKYVAVDAVLQRVGGKWDSGRKVHVFHTHLDAKSEFEILLSTGLMPEKNPLSFFETPPELAESMVRLMSNPHNVLEPSAGRGALVRSVLKNWSDVQIDAVELDEYNLQCLNAVFAAFKEVQVISADFLLWMGKSLVYDTVVMNPPFSAKGIPHLYVRHIWKAMEHLAYGGQLIFIAPSSYISSKQKPVAILRKHLESQWADYWLDKLPHGAFAPSGTNVSTVLVSVRRPTKYDPNKVFVFEQPKEAAVAKPKRKRKSRAPVNAGTGEKADNPAR